MKILGIESSCDETAAAIIEDGKKILANVVSSSKELHNKTGGVIPEVAAREQVKCMIPVLNETIHQCSNVTMENIDAIAVTVGPGLIGSLLVGVETAKTIAYVDNKPIIPVNHIFAHIYANFLDVAKEPEFPAIALVVSGGHTELFYMKNRKDLKWIGGTLDDAAGEAFDKTARLLGLVYPGGPAIAAAADKFNIKHSTFNINLPRPMLDSKDLNFSFSGLKAAVMREVNRLKLVKQLNNELIQQLSFEIQEAITDILVVKTLRAAKENHVKSILIGGGVAANKRLKEKLNAQCSIYNIFIPPPKLCTDNAAVIAGYAYFHYRPIAWKKIQAQPDLEVEV